MKNIIKFRVTGFLTMLAAIALFAVAAMFLWNALLPQLFGLPILTYRQAVGLMLLARILFGGLAHDFAGRRAGKGRGDAYMFHHGNKLREKWMNMSAEERKEFMEKEKDFFKFHRDFSRFENFFGREGNNKDDKNE